MGDVIADKKQRLLDRVYELDNFYRGKTITFRNMTRLFLLSMELYQRGIRETDIRRKVE